MPNQKWKPGENAPESGEYQLMDTNGRAQARMLPWKRKQISPTDKKDSIIQNSLC